MTYSFLPNVLGQGMVFGIAVAFGGSEVYRKERSDGSITHAEIRIGDSMLMVGEATA